MTPLALCLALLAQDSGHASLHPVDAAIYLEVPDLAAAVAAYPEAPLFAILREEEVRSFLSTLGVAEEDLDLAGLFDQAIEQVLPGARLSELALQTHTVSISTRAGGPDGPALLSRLVADFATPEAAAFAFDAMAQAVGGETLPGELGVHHATADGMELWFACQGTRLYYDLGAAGMPLDPEGWTPGFHTNPFREQAAEVLGVPEGVPLLHMVESAEGMAALDALTEDEGLDFEAMVEELGPGISDAWLAGTLTLADGRFVFEGYSSYVWPIVAESAVDAKRLDEVPGDAMFVGLFTFDGPALAEWMRHALALVDADGQLSAGFEAQLGFAPGAILEVLGPSFVVYGFPITGLGLPQTHAWMDLRDPEGFQEKVTRFFEVAAEAYPGVSARVRDYRIKNKTTDERVTIPVTTITLPQESLDLGPMMAISPSYAVAEGRLLLGISSIQVKRELKRLYGGDPEDAAAPMNPIALEGLGIPEDASTVLYMDWGAQIEAALGLARALAGLAGDGGFDPESLPSAESLTRHLRPTLNVTRILEGGTYMRHETSFGPETWAGLILGLSSIASSAPVPPPTQPIEAGEEVR